MLSDPLMVPQILARVGPAAMADWVLHLAGLMAFRFLHWDAQVRHESMTAAVGRFARELLALGFSSLVDFGPVLRARARSRVHCSRAALQPCNAPLQKYVRAGVIDKLPPKPRFFMRRALEAWKYGSGQDYKL